MTPPPLTDKDVEVNLMATAVNCWQFKKCGREFGGARTAEMGVCPASQAQISGYNHGMRGGRMCWAIAGTLCGNQVQGTYAQKIVQCAGCDFYKAVRREEGAGLQIMISH